MEDNCLSTGSESGPADGRRIRTVDQPHRQCCADRRAVRRGHRQGIRGTSRGTAVAVGDSQSEDRDRGPVRPCRRRHRYRSSDRRPRQGPGDSHRRGGHLRQPDAQPPRDAPQPGAGVRRSVRRRDRRRGRTRSPWARRTIRRPTDKAGAVYLFERATAELLSAKPLVSPAATAVEMFGAAVAMDADSIVVGAPASSASPAPSPVAPTSSTARPLASCAPSTTLRPSPVRRLRRERRDRRRSGARRRAAHQRSGAEGRRRLPVRPA